MRQPGLVGGFDFEGRRSQPLRVSSAALSTAQAHAEEAHLISLFSWLKDWALHYPELGRSFHTENEGALAGEQREYLDAKGRKRKYNTAGKKRQAKGVRSGVLDVLNLTPRGPYPYLAIELKVRAGVPTPEPAAEIAWMKTVGAFVHVCWCWSEAALLMLMYFGIEDIQARRSAGRPADYIVPRLGGHNERCACGLTI